MPDNLISMQIFNFVLWIANVFAVVTLGIVGWIVKNLVADVKRLTEEIIRIKVSVAVNQPPSWLLDQISEIRKEIRELQAEKG